MSAHEPRMRETGVFGHDRFGHAAERAARFFGTPKYIIGQSLVVVVWIILNAVALTSHWDPYPFILLNLAFSTQAAYAAPLILLAQTRQVERDKVASDQLEKHREAAAASQVNHTRAIESGTAELRRLLEQNTELTSQDKALTEQVAVLTREIKELLSSRSARP